MDLGCALRKTDLSKEKFLKKEEMHFLVYQIYLFIHLIVKTILCINEKAFLKH